jgi:8-oxo-dGTP diphosphatase
MDSQPVRLPYARLADVDWERWSPRQRATLLFVVRGGEILLMLKKRGLGAGKINGPGGRLEPGETPLACAVREVEEELCVTPLGVRACGELYFQFLDGLSIHGSVFRAEGCAGEPRETAEAVPLWTPIAEIPYQRMWADDRLWLPHLLAGRRFEGRFLFDGDRMLGGEVDCPAEPAPGTSAAGPARPAPGQLRGERP